MESSLRILDFDIENRPLTYLGGDFTNEDITVIAAAWVDTPDEVYCWAQDLTGEPSRIDMLSRFLDLYDQADIVTGHYIREHDLPIVNAHLVELGMRPLAPKIVQDTKVDLIGWKGISKSQENLAQTMGRFENRKVHMSNFEWREANRLTPHGVAWAKERAVGDVKQHIHMRAELIARRLLGPAREWRP